MCPLGYVPDDEEANSTTVTISNCCQVFQCTRTPNAAIAGHNKQVSRLPSLEACQAACLAASWCKSFDWKKTGDGVCYLSDKCAEDVGGVKTSYSGNPYDYYSCRCQAANQCDMIPNAAVPGHNYESSSMSTEESCQTDCLDASWCKTFDWARSDGKCFLSDKCAEDIGGVKTSYSGNPYDFYSCACQVPTYQCTLTPNAALAGHNREVMYKATVEYCQAACLAASWCKSFDWTRASGKCHLSEDCAKDFGGVKTSYRGNPHDYYSCRCQA